MSHCASLPIAHPRSHYPNFERRFSGITSISHNTTSHAFICTPERRPLSSRSDIDPLLGGGLLLGKGSEAEVRLDDAELREQLLGLLVGDGGVDNDIVTGDPVDGGGDLVLVTSLEGVDDAEDLGGVAASGGRVREDGADGLLGVDDEDRADGESNALGVDVGGVLVVDPGS